jgi:hypothetical protein
MALTQRLEATGERMNARNLTDWDIEDDGFVTIPTTGPLERKVYDYERKVYDYERMVNRLYDAVAHDDYDTVDEIVTAAHLKLHGPND